jgi:chromate transporter
MIGRECVDQERWISRAAFTRLLAVYQLLPGPEAHELCVYFGRIRGGRLGGLLAGLGFMAPGFVLMLLLSVLYVHAGLDERFAELFYGLQAAVAALVALAVVRFARRFLTSPFLAALGVAAFGATLAGAGFVIVLLAAGAVHWAWRARPSTAVVPSLAPFVLVGAISLPLAADILLEGLKAGLLTFGGAYTAVPLMQEGAVEHHHWLTQDQFLDGLALSGVLPAPLIIFCTFVGYLAGGLTGALLMTAGVFAPAFIFPTFLHDQLVAVAEDRRLHAFLDGVAAAVVGLIAAVTIDIVDAAVVDVFSALLALAAFGALLRWQGKLAMVFVVLGCGAVGAAAQFTFL